MAQGSEYNFTVVPQRKVPKPRPDVLPSPPTVAPPSKLAMAVGEVAKSFVPQANMDDIRSRLTAMAGPGAGYGPFIGQAVKGAAGVVSDLNTLKTEPAWGQPWYNAGVRLGTEVLGAARILHGGKRGGIEGTGPIIRAQPHMATTAELPPATGFGYVSKLKPVTGRDYLAAFRQNLAEGHDYGAANVIRNAGRENTLIPIMQSDMMKMGPRAGKEFMSYAARPRGY